jgi:hypothetical protein
LHSHDVVLKQWNELLSEMYCDEEQLKMKFIEMMLQDDNVSDIAKTWLKKIYKL